MECTSFHARTAKTPRIHYETTLKTRNLSQTEESVPPSMGGYYTEIGGCSWVTTETDRRVLMGYYRDRAGCSWVTTETEQGAHGLLQRQIGGCSWVVTTER